MRACASSCVKICAVREGRPAPPMDFGAVIAPLTLTL